jgi:hypothetical protein
LLLDRPVLDELSLPAVAACGVNMPSPDLLTPERAAAAIWSWAPGHPFAAAHNQERWHRLWCHLLRWMWHGLGMQQVCSSCLCIACLACHAHCQRAVVEQVVSICMVHDGIHRWSALSAPDLMAISVAVEAGRQLIMQTHDGHHGVGCCSCRTMPSVLPLARRMGVGGQDSAANSFQAPAGSARAPGCWLRGHVAPALQAPLLMYHIMPKRTLLYNTSFKSPMLLQLGSLCKVRIIPHTSWKQMI